MQNTKLYITKLAAVALAAAGANAVLAVRCMYLIIYQSHFWWVPIPIMILVIAIEVKAIREFEFQYRKYKR